MNQTPYLCIRIPQFEFIHITRITTIFIALSWIISAIAFFTLFHNLVSTEWSIILLKAVLLSFVTEYGMQYRWDIIHRTMREFVIILPFAAGRRRVHNKVSHRSTRATLCRIVVWRAKVVTNLVCQCQFADLRWYTWIVVHKRNNSGVKTSFRLDLSPANIFRICFVLFAYATRCPCKVIQVFIIIECFDILEIL